MEQAEKDLDGTRIKVPDEVSDEVCDVCGRQMVVKSGRFGRFLACPGFPDCTFTKPLVIEMPGKCPKCGSRILKKTSRNGYTLLRLRAQRRQDGPGLRLYDLGRAREGHLPGVRLDHVQKVRPGL